MQQTLPGLWYMMTILNTKPGDIRETEAKNVVHGHKNIPDALRHGPNSPL